MEKRYGDEPVLLLHKAELLIHKNSFDKAIKLLRKAQRKIELDIGHIQKSELNQELNHAYGKFRYVKSLAMQELALSTTQSQSKLLNLNHSSIKKLREKEIMNKVNWEIRKEKFQTRRLSSNIWSLLAVSLFRNNPNQPEVSIFFL
jgi:hypothetical protein